jgi:hypothetical protein
MRIEPERGRLVLTDAALAHLDRVGHESRLTTADRRLLALTRARLFLRHRQFDRGFSPRMAQDTGSNK